MPSLSQRTSYGSTQKGRVWSEAQLTPTIDSIPRCPHLLLSSPMYDDRKELRALSGICRKMQKTHICLESNNAQKTHYFIYFIFLLSPCPPCPYLREAWSPPKGEGLQLLCSITTKRDVRGAQGYWTRRLLLNSGYVWSRVVFDNTLLIRQLVW